MTITSKKYQNSIIYIKRFFGHFEYYTNSLFSTGWSKSGGIIINHIEMPSPEQQKLEKTSPASSSTKSSFISGPNAPTPPNKRVLDQEEFDRRLKAKRGTFSKKRSLSLASFKFSTPIKMRGPMEKLGSKLNLVSTGSEKTEKGVRKAKEDKDLKYLQKFKARGELDLLNLDSVIDVNDFTV